MIQVHGLSKSFLGRTLFTDVSFSLNSRERIGLVGRNGSGKSTLFSLLRQETLPDSGSVQIPKHYHIGHLEQHLRFTASTLLEECCQVLNASLEEGGPEASAYLAKKMLFGLGFTEQDFSKAPSAFSGGYQIRINLCKLLLQKPQLLLLDEPTNYLDIISLRWLRQFLLQFPGEVILITHDRDFMDSITTHTMGIVRKKIKKYPGSTRQFYEKIREEELLYEKTRENVERKKAHLEAFVDRFSAKASKASQAQSKLKQLEKMESLEELEAEPEMMPRFQFAPCPAKVLLTAKDLSFSYGQDLPLLFKQLSFTVGMKDRIGIIGKNGQGKSTLLNLIGREREPNTGSLSGHPLLAIGHLGQTNVERLNPKETIIEAITGSNPELSNTQVRQICGSMMFPGEVAEKKITVLSGGEKNRVLLGKILARATNLLLLDEPTNHLDMQSIDVLTEELKEYPGAIVIVTHSEQLLRQLVNKLIIFRKQGAEWFDGTYDEFLEKIGWDDEEEKKVKQGKVPVTEKNWEEQKIEKQKKAQQQRQLERIEKNIVQLESLLEQEEKKLLALSSEDPPPIATIQAVCEKIKDLKTRVDREYELLNQLE